MRYDGFVQCIGELASPVEIIPVFSDLLCTAWQLKSLARLISIARRQELCYDARGGSGYGGGAEGEPMPSQERWWWLLAYLLTNSKEAV